MKERGEMKEKKSKRENQHQLHSQFYIRVAFVDRRRRASVLVVNYYKFSKIIQLDIHSVVIVSLTSVAVDHTRLGTTLQWLKKKGK